ncbi:aldehyde dehydrogenase [Roseomonas aeriglobus]|nr:aldehyde dehydrogenase [Roseomonas aeriglobus]
MNQAITPLRHPDKFYIDGVWRRPSSDATITVVSPATEQPYMRVAEALEADVDAAVDAARRAFDLGPWPRMSPLERATYLTAIGDALDARAGDVAAIWPNEMGIVHRTAQTFAGAVGSVYRYYAGLAENFSFEDIHTPLTGNGAGLLVREPVGVVGAIIPWNGPISLIAWKLAPALLAGCTVVIKASPEAPGHALLMAEIAEQIGLPAGVLNVLTADRDASEALVRHPGIDKITFTGSTVAGKRIASILGERVARYTLELGGKSAAVVLDDYDIDAAAATIAQRSCLLTGQVCAAISRIVVPRNRHDQMVEALSAHMGRISVGDPFDAQSDMGPLATARQRDRVEGYIAGAVSDGAMLATGGKRPTHLDRGYFIEPTVFGKVDNTSRLAREEVFGPVLAVIPADDEEDAVAIANDSDFGLAGAVYTNDVDRAYAVMRRMRTGTISHNAPRIDFGIAFGGFKQSGVGREGGVEGLLPFLETKTLLLDTMPSRLANGG